MNKNLHAWILAGILASSLLPWSGCGSSSPEFGEPSFEVAQLVGCISDSARSPQTFTALFSSATPPDDTKRREMAFYVYVAKAASVSGDEATIKVEVREPRDNTPIGEVEWTAVKEGGNWKLKDTPMPAQQPGA